MTSLLSETHDFSSSSRPPFKKRRTGYQCEQCGKVLSQRKSLFRHRNTCAEGKRWICRLCGESFSRADVRQRHEDEQHRNKKRKDNFKRSGSAVDCVATEEIGFAASLTERFKHPPGYGFTERSVRTGSTAIEVTQSQAHRAPLLNHSTTSFSCSATDSHYCESNVEQEFHDEILVSKDADVEQQLQNDSGVDLRFDEQIFSKFPPTEPVAIQSTTHGLCSLDTSDCPLCGRAFIDGSWHALDHLKTHFNEFDGCFACDECEVTFRREADLSNHLKSSASGFCGYGFEHRTVCTGHHGLLRTPHGAFPDGDRLSFCNAVRLDEQTAIDELSLAYCTAMLTVDRHSAAQYWNVCAQLGQNLTIPVEISLELQRLPFDNYPPLSADDLPVGIEWKVNASPSTLLRARRPIRLMSALQMKEALLFACAEGNIDRVLSILDQGVPADIHSSKYDDIGMVFSGTTPLALAAFHGHLQIVQLLLRSGADPNFICKDQQTALHLASRGGHFDIVSELLQNQANVLAEDRTGRTALHNSIYKHPAIAELLLEYGAAGHGTLQKGHGPFEEAIRLDDATATRLMLRYGADPNYTVPVTYTGADRYLEGVSDLSRGRDYGDIKLFKDDYIHGVPVLWLALRCESLKAAEVLLNFGAKVNARLSNGGSMLRAAIDLGSFAAAKLLLNYGANPCNFPKAGVSIFEQAFQRSSWSAVTFLLNHAVEVGEMAIDKEASMVHRVKLLLPRTADLLWRDGAQASYLPDQAKPSSSAVTIADCNLVLKLLLCGAPIDDDGGDLSVALCCASALGSTEIAKSIIARGVDLEATGGTTGNALCYAASLGHTQTMHMLIAHGARMDYVGGSYGSILNAVAGGRIYLYNRVEVAIALLDSGADVNLQVPICGTALYHASDRGRPELVQLFINRGANVNQRGGKFGTPLCAAATKGHVDIVKLLLRSGADVDTEGVAGTILCKSTSAMAAPTAPIRVLTWERYFDVMRELQQNLGIDCSSRYDIILRLILRRDSECR